MKTIKEKAKDYDETLERALYGKYCINNVLEYLFPELAESKEEDERIRKTIIGFLKNIEEENESYLIFDNTTTTDMIAWLEKQESEPNWCHHKVDLSNCSEEYRKAYYDGWNNCNMQHSQCKSEGNDVVKCLINGMKFYYEDNEEATWGTEKFSMKVKDILSWLEKQGEEKVPVLDFKAKDWYVSKVDGKIHNIYYSVDKPEPKFKVGDWVVDNCDYVWKIEGILNQFYILECVEGGESRPTIEWVDKTFHLWTIQDAKPGDVLVCEDFGYTSLMLFESFSDGRISLHCWYNSQTNNFHINTNVALRKDANIHPATKEQRDLLFQKMKESGYGWDAEKKELKLLITNGGDFFESENCEQKPTEWSLPYGKNETAEKLIALAEILEMDGDCLFNGVSGNSYGKFLRVLAKELTEVKPAEWSKEDDVMVHDILGWLPAKSRPEYNQRRADWLKSLKGRVQPKQEWSEEDEKIRQTIINEFEQCSEWCCSNGLTKEDCINWLNRQKYFEWSDEDNENMNSLCVLLDQMVSINAIGNEHSIEYKNWLKSLKDRVQSQPKQEWKQENREELTEFENAMMHIGDSFFGENAGLDPNDTATIKEQAELLLELAPKTEWSEEDERMLNLIIQDYEAASKSFCGHKGKLYWLKSFKKE